MKAREAEAEAAMGDLAAALMRGGSMPMLAARSVLDALERHEDLMELDASVLVAVQRMDASAQGEAGDAKKYKAAKASMLRRWNLFLVVHASSLYSTCANRNCGNCRNLFTYIVRGGPPAALGNRYGTTCILE